MTLITLPDGRSLDLHVQGPPSAPVLVFHHGTPGDGGVPRGMSRVVAERGLRLVTWSRPGYHVSSRAPGRAVADVARDLEAVLDHLEVETVVTAGASGGGPHALACGALLPHRVRAVGVIAGVAPYIESAGSLAWLDGMGQGNVEEFDASLEGEESLRAYLAHHVVALREATPAVIVESLASLLPDVDRAHITAEFGEDMAASFRAALSHGADGWVDDDLAFVRPWGFDLGAITVPTSVWQGSADLMVPFAHGGWLGGAVPGATTHLVEGEGHLSLGVGLLGDILDEVLALGGR
jgi:pimeloyl-ACP methyl ester carboxylesterase